MDQGLWRSWIVLSHLHAPLLIRYLAQPFVMSTDEIPILRQTIAEMRQQLKAKEEDLDELKQDKRYLRAHNEELKGEVAHLKAELRESVSQGEKLAGQAHSAMVTSTSSDDGAIRVRFRSY
jgi:septal ring factor EnvC (AmiA/AmiB activator)